MMKFRKFDGNPILLPRPSNQWESRAVFNPGVVKIGNKIYIIYRAMGKEDVSYLGLAVTRDGFNIEERLDIPIETPKRHCEIDSEIHKHKGFEDPRVTVIGDRIFMLYTVVYDIGPRLSVRVGMTSIKIWDFVRKKWDKWEDPKLISPPGTWDKDACLLDRKIKGKYVFFHRILPNIWIDFVNSLDFKKNAWILGYNYINIRPKKWDNDRIGVAGPPIYTKEGWLLIYHGRSSKDGFYRLGAMLLDKNNPTHVITRLDHPILEPEKWYERDGMNVVFSCGHAMIKDEIFLYYGASDKYIGVATGNINDLLSEMIKR